MRISSLFVVSILFTIISPSCFGQNHSSEIERIHCAGRAKKYADLHKEVLIVEYHEESQDGNYQKNRANINKDNGFTTINQHYKLIGRKKVKLYRVRYLFINENDFSPDYVDSLFTKITLAYNSGVDFSALVKEYSMDKSDHLGDVGWFNPNDMVKGFREAVLNSKKGDFFECEEVENNWRFLVEVIESPKKVKGHQFIVYPLESNIENKTLVDHSEPISRLSGIKEAKNYSESFPEVQLVLLSEVENVEYFELINSKQSSEIDQLVIDFYDERLQIITDTISQLVSFDFFYMNNDPNDASFADFKINIEKLYADGVAFENIKSHYVGDDNPYRKFENIDTSLLDEGLKNALLEVGLNELVFVPYSDGFIVGLLLEMPRIVPAYIGISYPKI